MEASSWSKGTVRVQHGAVGRPVGGGRGLYSYRPVRMVFL